MKGKKKYIVLVMLLVMLAAAVTNYFFMHRLYNKTVAFYESQDDGQMLQVETTGGAAQPLKTDVKFSKGNVNGYSYVPSWYGDLKILSVKDKTCELELVSEVPNGPAVKLSAFEVTIKQDGPPPKNIVPIFRQDGKGKLLATVVLPEAGTWQVDVRMHFNDQTLELSRRLTVPAP